MSSESSSQNQIESTEKVEREESTHPAVTLGDYRLLRQLGSGGMGAVYEAVHVRLDKRVAVKVLASNRLKDADSVARFEREMKAVGKLNHPNIIQAFDAREENGVHFLVLEYIEGGDLGEVSNELGQLPIADACEMIRQAAEGLQNAHEHGLVHRDIKPSNLFLSLTRNSQNEITSGTVKVLDLGLALLNGEGQGEELTTTGQVMGTLDYIAPEQIQDTHTVDIRADLYALGCTLYKLLSGKAPFADSQGAIKKMRAHADLDVPNIEELRNDIPDELANIIQRLLKKDPAQRFDTPAELAIALQPFCEGVNLVSIGQQLPKREELPVILESVTVDGISQTGGTETIIKSTVPDPDASEPTRLVTNSDDSSTTDYKPSKKPNIARWIGVVAAILISLPVANYIYTSTMGNRFQRTPFNPSGIEVESTSVEVAAIAPPAWVLEFDGVDDYVEMKGLDFSSDAITLEVYVESSDVNTSGRIAALTAGDDFLYLYDSKPGADGVRVGGVGAMGDNGYVNLAAPVEYQIRQHRAVVLTRSEMRYYIDGKFQKRRAVERSTKLPLRFTEMFLGRSRGGDEFFSGKLSGVRVSEGERYLTDFIATPELVNDEQTVALFDFSKNTGTTLEDTSGNNIEGEIHGATWRAVNSYSMSFDGRDDYIVVESLKLDDFPEDQPLTIEFMVKRQEGPQSNMVSWMGENWIAVFETSGIWGIGDRKESPTNLRKGATLPQYDQWTHLAAVRDAVGWRLYVNGRSTYLTFGAYKLEPTTGGLYIGGAPLEKLTGHTYGRWHRGELDELRISKIARYTGDSYEVQDSLTTDENTLALYHFNDSTPDTATDSSGNQHHGKIIGATRVERSSQ